MLLCDVLLSYTYALFLYFFFFLCTRFLLNLDKGYKHEASPFDYHTCMPFCLVMSLVVKLLVSNLNPVFLHVFSKQRHNKLWRSHSDSDLSEQQEPVCKSQRTLGRSDPHNQQHKPRGTRSVNGVLQTINSSQLGTENSHTDLSTHTISQKKSQRPCEDPLLPALPRARAATVVPEQNLADNCHLKVSVMKPIAHPRSPPSLHELAHSLSTSLYGNKTVPEPSIDSDNLSLNVPDQNDSLKNSQSSGTPGLALLLGTVSRVTETRGDLASLKTPMAICPCEDPQESRCSTNSNSESCNSDNTTLKTGSPSSLGTDSIDFFRAREKFLSSTPFEVMTPHIAQTQSHSICTEEPNLAATKEVKELSYTANLQIQIFSSISKVVTVNVKCQPN